MSLTGQAWKFIWGLDNNKLSCDQGVQKLLEELNMLYLKDIEYSVYEVYEKFENFVDPNQ